MRKRRKPDRTREDLSATKERAWAMGVLAVIAVIATHLAWGMSYPRLALGILGVSALAMLVLFAGTEKQARPLIILLKPFIWIVRIFIDLVFFLVSFLAF